MIYGVVKIIASGPVSLTVTIPADIKTDLGLKAGEKLLVSVDDMGRIIYERQKPFKIGSVAVQQIETKPVSVEGDDPDIVLNGRGWV